MSAPNFPSFGASDADTTASDELMVSQWLDLRRPAAEAMPEKRLALAVLEDGLRCAASKGMGAGCRAARREALEWLQSAVMRPFSFAGVCDTLGLDCDSFRAGVQVWLAAGGSLARRLPVVTHHAKPLAERYERRRA